jgi:AbrB family looped-hinge helix DNA binding protein
MSEQTAFLGVATVGAKGQIVIPADARTAMKIEEGSKVVVLRGPREGSIILFRVDSLESFWARAIAGVDAAGSSE